MVSVRWWPFHQWRRSLVGPHVDRLSNGSRCSATTIQSPSQVDDKSDCQAGSSAGPNAKFATQRVRAVVGAVTQPAVSLPLLQAAASPSGGTVHPALPALPALAS